MALLFVIEVPIEQCSNLTGCLSCVVNVNPLCGWCTVEQKCSRRLQCQNSTLAGSWLQGGRASSQCHTNGGNTAMLRDSNHFNYTSVIPTNTIPSGGITLNFIGTFPHTTLKAVFVVINGSTSECEQKFGTLKCIAPPLGPIDFIGPDVYLVAGVNYTIVMEGVPGPVGDSLNLAVYPDPVFLSIRVEDQIQTAGSVKPIRIDGYYISNVDKLFEINVTVGGEVCAVDSRTTTDTTVTCQPPQFHSLQSSYNALVRVTVGKYLNYTPGNITLLVPNKAEAFPIATAVGGGVAGLSLLLLALALVVAAILVIHRRKSLHTGNLTGGLITPLLVEREGLKTGLCSLEMDDFMRYYRGAIIPSDKIRVLNAIGNGEFGVVYKAHLLSDKTDQHQHVAVKTLKGLFTMRDLLNMMSEILKMQDFSHPHVMTLMGMSFDAANTPSMVMPYMANGSLLSYLKMNRALLLVVDVAADVDRLHASEKLLTRICCQVAKGMEYLSAQKFVHRDLAARNCMIDADGVIKVGDFGLSEDVYISGYFRLDKESRGVKLPFKWLAPESIQDGVFNEKTDVWSFGVTCWEVFTVGSVPYPGLDPCDLPTFLRNGRRLEKPQNAACSETMYSLMLRCWDSDPEDRPTFAKIAVTISKALQIMSDYLDLSMKVNAQNGNHESAIADTRASQMSTDVAVGNEPEATIQTSVCEAYTHMPRSDDYVNQTLASGGLNNPPGTATMDCAYEFVQ
eukprot:Em0021g723a